MARDLSILAAAEELFYERGFDAVGVDDIGERAGITGPAIYRHFSGKAEILAVLFDRAVDELVAATAGTFEDPREELDHLIRAHAAYVIEHWRLASIWAREDRALQEPFRRRHHRRERQYIARWVEVLGRVHPDRSSEDVTSVVWAVTSMLNSIGTWPRAARERKDLADLLTELVESALSALTSPATRG
jgi:AcrR family transcriptional regulator